MMDETWMGNWGMDRIGLDWISLAYIRLYYIHDSEFMNSKNTV